MGCLRLTDKTRIILGVLYEARDEAPLYGYKITELTGIPAPQVYPVLDRLTAAGLLDRVWEQPGDGHPPRRYAILRPEHHAFARESSRGAKTWTELMEAGRR